MTPGELFITFLTNVGHENCKTERRQHPVQQRAVWENAVDLVLHQLTTTIIGFHNKLQKIKIVVTGAIFTRVTVSWKSQHAPYRLSPHNFTPKQDTRPQCQKRCVTTC